MTQTSKASVIVTWDRAGIGALTDTCGPAAASWLSAHGFAVGPIEVVASEWSDLSAALTRAVANGQHLVTICGGVGLGVKDISPQVVEKMSDYAIPGLGELWRRESLKYSLSSEAAVGLKMARCSSPYREALRLRLSTLASSVMYYLLRSRDCVLATITIVKQWRAMHSGPVGQGRVII